jgi:hypothetical protein
MAKTMIASQTGMTDGQIDNICAKLRDALRRHRNKISSEAAQLAIGAENIGMKMFVPFREQAEALSEIIVRRVKVKRNRKPQEAIATTRRSGHISSEVVAQMPGRGEEEEEIDVYFFPLRKYTGVADVQKLIESHNLIPDAYAVAAVNEADPSFAEDKPNGTQWVDEKGKFCCIIFFNHWNGERGVDCRCVCDWSGNWWFGGVRK